MGVMAMRKLTLAEMHEMQMEVYGYGEVTVTVNGPAYYVDLLSWVEGDGTVQAPFSSPHCGDRIVFRIVD